MRSWCSQMSGAYIGAHITAHIALYCNTDSRHQGMTTYKKIILKVFFTSSTKHFLCQSLHSINYYDPWLVFSQKFQNNCLSNFPTGRYVHRIIVNITMRKFIQKQWESEYGNFKIKLFCITRSPVSYTFDIFSFAKS